MSHLPYFCLLRFQRRHRNFKMDILFGIVLVDVLAGRHSNPTPSSVLKTRSQDAVRAFILLLLILTILKLSKAEKQPQCTKPSPPECQNDCDDKKWFLAADPVGGTVTCQLNAMSKCNQLDCPPGFRPDLDCVVKEGTGATCVPVCPPGMFLDLVGDVRCVHCRYCDNTEGDTECSAVQDGTCGRCIKGYYHERARPDLCHKCSLLSQPELEPQCQTTIELPSIVTTVDSTSAKDLHQSSAELTTDAHPQTTVLSTQKSLEGMTEEITEPPGAGIKFEAEPSPEKPEEKETDEKVKEFPVPDYLIAILVISSVALVLMAVKLYWKNWKQRYERIVQRRQEMRASFKSYLQANQEEDNFRRDPENGDGTVDINWQDGSVRYDLTAGNQAPEDNHQLGCATDKQGESIINLQSIDETAEKLDGKPRELQKDDAAEAPFERDNFDSDQQSDVFLDDDETTEESAMLFQQENTSCMNNEGRVSPLKLQMEQQQAAAVVTEPQDVADGEGGNPLEPEGIIYKSQGSQTVPDGSTSPEQPTASTSRRAATADPSPNPHHINVVCKGNKNKINVNCACHRNPSFNYSETESESDD